MLAIGVDKWLSDWGSLLAASTSAFVAIIIARLTRKLVKITDKYAESTESMARSTHDMALTAQREREHRRWELERDVAQELISAALEGESHIDMGATDVSDLRIAKKHILNPFLKWSGQLMDPELRDRVNVALHMVASAPDVPDLNQRWGKHRAWRALVSVRESLQHSIRNEPLPARELPHYQRVLDWLTADDNAKVTDPQFHIP